MQSPSDEPSVPEPLSPALAGKIAALWESVEPKALGVARRLTKDIPDANAEAEELVQKAFFLILDGRRHWDPNTDLLTYVCSVVGNLWTHRVRELNRQDDLDPNDTGGPPASWPDPERLLALKREHEENVAQLDELALEFPEGSPERGVIALTREDITEPAEQAARLGVDVNVVYNARRNLGNAMERLQRARRAAQQRAQGGGR